MASVVWLVDASAEIANVLLAMRPCLSQQKIPTNTKFTPTMMARTCQEIPTVKYNKNVKAV